MSDYFVKRHFKPVTEKTTYKYNFGNGYVANIVKCRHKDNAYHIQMLLLDNSQEPRMECIIFDQTEEEINELCTLLARMHKFPQQII